MGYELTRDKFLSDEEVTDLEERLACATKLGKRRDSALLYAALHTGARVSEVLSVRPTDIKRVRDADRDYGTVYIAGLKGSRNREIPIPDWLFKMLQREAAGKTDRVFPISYNRFRQIWFKYRPVKKKAHSLRHTFAVRLFRKTKDLKIVQTALGHRSTRNTLIYLDFEYGTEELRKALLG